MRFGAHHEWGKLREAMIGISPAEDFVVFHEESLRWMSRRGGGLQRKHAGRRLIDVDAEWARRCERQVDALAELVAREGVTVHRPQRLDGAERTFLAAKRRGSAALPTRPMIVVGDHVIEPRCGWSAGNASATACGRPSGRWSSSAAPAGRACRWARRAAVDGPFLEGGDTLLNGHQVYVGISGCASDLAGVDWLQALLGEPYRVLAVAMKSNVLHLDCCLALVRPGLLIWCPEKLIDGLPMALRDWDKIAVSVDEANRLATNGLVLEEGRMILDSDNVRAGRGTAPAQGRGHSPALRRPDPGGRQPALRPSSAAARERAGLTDRSTAQSAASANAPIWAARAFWKAGRASQRAW